MMRSNFLILFLFFTVICCGCVFPVAVQAAAAAAAGEEGEGEDGGDESEKKIVYHSTQEVVTFINFSNEIVQLNWVDPNTGDEFRSAWARPYQLATTQTLSGHVFSYKWGQARLTHTVDETSTIGHPKWEEDGNNKDEEDDEEEQIIVPQIHILGDMNVDTLSPEMKKEYYELVASAQSILKKKSDTVIVECGTTEGTIRINVKPFWSPRGAARFLELIDMSNSIHTNTANNNNNNNNPTDPTANASTDDDTKTPSYYDGCALNRVVPKFLTQFGISRDYKLRTKYRMDTILDDDALSIPFKPGYMSYAGSGPNSRTTEVFVVMPDTPQSQLNYFGENSWETPFGYVEEKYLDDVVSKWYSDYGDMGPWGNGPNPQKIYEKGGYDKYLKEKFTSMSYIRDCVILSEEDIELAPLNLEEL